MDQTSFKKEFSILSLGDSYTIGEGVELKERWPVQMVERLLQQGIVFKAPEFIARTGWTTDELMGALKHTRIHRNSYDLVTLLIGVNNQYRGRDTQNFCHEFRLLLNEAVELANQNPRRVLVLSIPDWSATPFAHDRNREKIAQEIDSFNRIKRDETIDRRAHFVDITDISRAAKGEGQRMLAADTLHPSGHMYRLWAERAAAVIAQDMQFTLT